MNQGVRDNRWLVKLVIPIPTPSQNEWGKLHFGQETRWKKQMMFMVRGAVVAAGGKKLMPVGCKNRGSAAIPVRARFVRYGHGKLDRENFVGGCKGLVDVLRAEGLIMDDSEAWWHAVYEPTVIERSRPKQRTEIELWWDEPIKQQAPSFEEPKQAEASQPKQAREDTAVASKAKGKLFDFENQNVVVMAFTAKESEQVDKDTILTDVRIALVVSNVDPARVALLTDGQIDARPREEKEGPNCIDVTIKRDWPKCTYRLSDTYNKRFSATFSGRPVNRPKCSLVDGKVSIHWTVEDNQLGIEQAKNVLKCLRRDEIKISTTQIEETQGELVDLEERKAAAA